MDDVNVSLEADDSLVEDGPQTRGKLSYELLLGRHLDRINRISGTMPQSGPNVSLKSSDRDYTYNMSVRQLHEFLEPYHDGQYLKDLAKLESEFAPIKQQIVAILDSKASPDAITHQLRDFRTDPLDKSDLVTSLYRRQFGLIMCLLHRRGLMLENSKIGEW